MKKTIIYTAFWLATAGIALTSCEDIFGGFLDKQPSNELTEEEVFSQWTTTQASSISILTTSCATVPAASTTHGWMQPPT